jgi:hypothetical protein
MSKNPEDGILDLEDAVDQSHLEDYAIEEEDSSQTEKRSNIDPKWSFDFVSMGLRNAPELAGEHNMGDIEDVSSELGLIEDMRLRHFIMVIYKTFLVVETTMSLKIKDKAHNRDLTYVAIMTVVEASGITSIMMISNVAKTYIAYADKSKVIVLKNAYPDFIRKRLKIRMGALNKPGMSNVPDKCANQTARYELWWLNFYHGLILTGMRVDEKVFNKESLTNISAISTIEGEALLASLIDLRRLYKSSPRVISRNLMNMELWNRYIPLC